MSAERSVFQVTACRIPAGDDACYVRYRLLEPVDRHLPTLFHDAVTMLSPLQDGSGHATCLIEVCKPGRYQASSFQGSSELEVYFHGARGSIETNVLGFDRRIESLGMGLVSHRDQFETVS